MVSLEVVAILLSGISISASLFYYANVLRNTSKSQQIQQETRQTSTYIQTIGFRDANFMKAYGDVFYFQKYDDYEDWMKKYHPTGKEWKDEYKDSWANFFAIGNTFQSTGLLVSQGIISPEMVFEQEGELIMSLWERMGPLIVGLRRDGQSRMFFSYYESLYDEMKKIRNQKYPELDK